MIMSIYSSIFVSALVVLQFASMINGVELPNGGKIWALLAAGSTGYDNYRHQADVCHAYQILHENGIPDENIIVMMYDDIANNSKNPDKGVILNTPGGPNVYTGVLKDYTYTDVTPSNFLKVLSGDEEGMKGVGSGRVIKSGPNDHVFVNLVDHGAKGIVGFPDGVLYASDLINTLKEIEANNQFAKLVFYLEACEAGSMFENILPDDLNIYAVTASNPTESSYSCCYDDDLNVWLGDDFSVNWMQDSEEENLAQEQLQQQFEVVQEETTGSHVQEYGDLTIGSLYVSEFIGVRSSASQNLVTQQTELVKNDLVSSRDAALGVLQRKYAAAKTPEEKQHYHSEISKFLKKRQQMEKIIDDILLNATDNDEAKVELIKGERYNLKLEDYDCYKKLVTAFSEKCFHVTKNLHALKHVHVFANVCGRKDISEDSVVKAITDVCSTQSLPEGVN